MSDISYFLTHGVDGIQQWSFNGSTKKLNNAITFNSSPAGGDDPKNKPSDMFLSQSGNFFAIATKETLKLYKQKPDNGSIELKPFLELPVPDARQVNFSPKGNFVAVNAPLYTVNDCNLKIFNLKDGKLLLGKLNS